MNIYKSLMLGAAGLSLTLGLIPKPEPGLVGMDAETALTLFGVPDETEPSRDMTIWRWSEEQAELVLMEDRVFQGNAQAVEALAGEARPALGEPVPEAGVYLGMSVEELALRAGPFLRFTNGASSLNLTFAGGLEACVIGGRVASVQR